MSMMLAGPLLLIYVDINRVPVIVVPPTTILTPPSPLPSYRHKSFYPHAFLGKGDMTRAHSNLLLPIPRSINPSIIHPFIHPHLSVSCLSRDLQHSLSPLL